MSLRWRIMGATVLVIVLTVLISVGVGYYSTQYRLGVFIDRLGDDEARRLARNLSREYTASGGWETVDEPLSEAGYLYDEVPERERTEGHEGESVEIFHRDPLRIVIVGADGTVVKDNLSELPPGTSTSSLDGHQERVTDLSANRTVGYVYVDVSRDFLSAESHGFLNTLLFTTVVGGILTVGIAIFLAAWLSRRITAPVTALTDAAQAIAQGDKTELPITSSDELGKMSEAFNRMTSALETQRDLRRRLINDVSHELNTPLSVIQLEARGLRDGLQAPESASEHIIREVDRLRGLVSDLNYIAETDHGELWLTLEEISVYDLLNAEAQRWRPQLEARQVELSQQISADIPNMQLDRDRLSQALGNILSNAIDCTEAGGKIVFRAAPERDKTLAISVADDGIGIHPTDLHRVFDRFYRTEQSRERGIAGTGLGLAIAQAIVEAHGGAIAVASAGLGQGTTVTIRLPLAK